MVSLETHKGGWVEALRIICLLRGINNAGWPSITQSDLDGGALRGVVKLHSNKEESSFKAKVKEASQC